MFSDKTDTVSFVKDDEVDGGDADYARFHAMKAELRAGRMVNWREITEAQKAELQEIAERNSGRASEMAKGVLCFYHGICLEDRENMNTKSDNTGFENCSFKDPCSGDGIGIRPRIQSQH